MRRNCVPHVLELLEKEPVIVVGCGVLISKRSLVIEVVMMIRMVFQTAYSILKRVDEMTVFD